MATDGLLFDSYPFLKDLGLEKENLGCYNGTWCGSGEVINCKTSLLIFLVAVSE